jgi:hypothetical protein
MKVYKDGAKINADKDQWPALEAAGWVRSPEDSEKASEVKKSTDAEEPKVEKSTKEPEAKKASVKKTASKRRKPIAKKSDSEE